MHPIATVFRKEAIDGLRDRRAVASAMLFPILGPVLAYVFINVMINMGSPTDDLVVPVVGVENAPHLIQYMLERGVRLEKFDGDARKAVSEQKQEFVLIIPDAYRKQHADGYTSVVELVSDSSRADARQNVRGVRALINGYSQNIAALRLISRGVSPEVMRVVTVADIEIASKQQIAAQALNFVPMYIVMAAFVAGMGIAVDATAGERERSTLESLLIHPIDGVQIILGKWLAASAFAAFGMLLALMLNLIVLYQVPLHKIGLTYSIRTPQIIGMIASTLPLAFLATSMQMLLGIFAKSFKDAQSYIGLLIMLPILPGILTMFSPMVTRSWMYAVPGLSQHLLLTGIMGGKNPPLIGYVLAAVTTFIFAMMFVSITARLLNRESVIFN